tara:strand:- start:132 stop:821 length:690 start_codon:yes stop_codon:yes gene_type:complete
MAGIKVHTAETEFVVDTDDLKNHLKISGTDDNDTLDVIRVACHNWAKNYTKRTLTTVTYQLFLDSIYQPDRVIQEGKYVGIDQDINRRSILLPFSPVASVTHFKSYDDDDTATTFASSKYYLSTSSVPAKITLRQGESYPTGLRVADAFEIQYVAGYGGRTAVPVDIKNACLIYAGYLFEHRGDTSFSGSDYNQSVPYIATQLLAPYVVRQFSTNPFRGTASFGGLYGF